MEGYELADVVEYVERARRLADGEWTLPAGAVRSAFFSLLFVPAFWLARWAELADLAPLMALARTIQMAFGVALVLATARFATRFAAPDRQQSTGLVAGLLLVANPVFLRFSVAPVADIAGALFLLFAVDRLLERGTTRRALVGGLWLGLACITSYKYMALAGLLVVCCAARERWRGRYQLLALVSGVSLWLAFQVFLEHVVFGVEHSSLAIYLHQNATSRLTHIAFGLHRSSTGWISAGARAVAVWLHGVQNAALGMVAGPVLEARMRTGPVWYLSHISELLVLPVLLLVVFGLASFLSRPSWPHTLVLVLTLGYGYLTSTKGDKALRLWLPIAPFLALWAAVGLELLQRAGPQRLRAASTALVLVASAWLCSNVLTPQSLCKHAAYWKAQDFVNAEAGPGERVGAAFAWAVFLRERSDLELVPTPRQMMAPPPPRRSREGPAPEDGELLAWIEGLDWFLVHVSALDVHSELFEPLGRSFDVRAAFYDQACGAELGPVLVLKHVREAGPPRHSLLYARCGDEARDLSGSTLRRPVCFERVDTDGRVEELTLLGFELDRLPGSPGLWWLTYHWTSPTGLAHDYQIVDRWSAHDGRGSFQQNHWPGHGVRRTPTWKPGEIVSEGTLFVPAADPFAPGRSWHPLGGSYRRGDLVPLSLYLQIADLDPRGSIVGAMRGPHPAPPYLEPPLDNAFPSLCDLLDAGRGLPEALAEVALRMSLDENQTRELAQRVQVSRDAWRARGELLTKDGLVEVARIFLSVDPAARLADDGHLVLD